MEIGRGVHIGTATNRSNGLLQLSSFSYGLMKGYFYFICYGCNLYEVICILFCVVGKVMAVVRCTLTSHNYTIVSHKYDILSQVYDSFQNV